MAATRKPSLACSGPFNGDPIRSFDRTHRQYQLFIKIKEELNSAGICIEETSCANSGAIEQNISLEETHIRPGLMLYGPNCGLKNSLWKGRPISCFQTEVIKIFPVKKGTPIGYGSHIVGKDGFIVYLPIGYGDGVLTYYTGNHFEFNGTKAQIIGRVNMDLTALFFENLPTNIQVGSKLSLWNENDDIPELAARLKTSPYQIFTALSNRVPRRYLQ